MFFYSRNPSKIKSIISLIILFSIISSSFSLSIQKAEASDLNPGAGRITLGDDANVASGNSPNLESAVAERLAKSSASNSNNNGECFGLKDSPGFDIFSPFLDVENCINQLTYNMFKGMTVLVTYSGMVMDFSFTYSALEFGERVKSGKRVKSGSGLGDVMVEGWRTFRDLANIVFIFVLLYAAIGIIIGLNIQSKKIVGMVIIIAILINFSYFLTGLVIDSSNILALQFHKALQGTPNDSTQAESGGSFRYGQIFMQSIRLGDFYDPNSVTNGQQFAASVEGQENPNGITEATSRFILGFVMLLVAMFVFISAAVLFLIRMIVLIFLLMLSPLAFVASVLPNTKQYFSQWWNALLSQSFFAPIFFMLLWISIKILQSPGFTSSIGLNGGTGSGQGSSIISIAVGFSIAIGLLIFSILAGKKMGVVGANSVVGTGNQLKGWGIKNLKLGAGAATIGAAGLAGRQVVGRSSAFLADRGKLNQWAANSGLGGVVARATQRTLRRGAAASYDARNAPGLSGAAAALGIGKGAGAGGYMASVQKAAEKQAEKARLNATPTLNELNDISKSKEEKDSIKKFMDELKETQKYKDAEDNIKDQKAEVRRIESEIKNANAAGNTSLEAALKGQLVQQNINLKGAKDALSKIRDNDSRNKFGKNWSDLEKTIKTLDKSISQSTKAAKERQRAQVAGIGGLTKFVTRGRFSRERVREAAVQKTGE